jgi:hypothetical protein
LNQYVLIRFSDLHDEELVDWILPEQNRNMNDLQDSETRTRFAPDDSLSHMGWPRGMAAAEGAPNAIRKT